MTAGVLGLDGGGSHTVCVILDLEGREAGRAQAGPCNHQSTGAAAAQAAMREAIVSAQREAGERAGSAGVTLLAACLGMAGLDREADLALIRRLAEPLLPGIPLEIVHDAEIVLAAGTGGERRGVVVIGGTGSIAMGFDGRGRRARAGGWGHLLGDEGSGYALASQGLKAAARALDGRGPETALAGLLAAEAGVTSFEELADRIYLDGWSVGQVAALAPAVLAAAERGDAVSKEIVEGAASELALAASVVIRRLDLEDMSFPVILSGGLFASSARLAGRVREKVEGLAPRAAVGLLAGEPAYGAALMALEKARQRPQPLPRQGTAGNVREP